MTTTKPIGRLGNQIIRNLAVSVIAEKHNLYVEYSSYEIINNLGIKLFCGENKYNNTVMLTDENYFSIFHNQQLLSNLNPNENFFQTKEISNYLYNHINNTIKQNIIDNNKFKERYDSNNDLFIHIRLDDATKWNPGINYYLKTISGVNFNKLYISTDTKEHIIINKIKNQYPKTIILNYDEITTINFGSACKHVILSHGSFSAIIGYLSFFSNIYYPEYETNKIWYGDMFSINGWNKISNYNSN
jgi:hypothetical protein